MRHHLRQGTISGYELVDVFVSVRDTHSRKVPVTRVFLDFANADDSVKLDCVEMALANTPQETNNTEIL